MQFNSDDHQDARAPLTGKHRFRIDLVTEELTKTGGHPSLNVEMTLTEGPFKGRKHWERFVLEHDNPDVGKISRGRLSSLSRAVGKPQWNNQSELHGRIGEATFGPQKNAPEYTEIKSYTIPEGERGAPAANPHRDVNVGSRNGQLQASLAHMPPTPPPDAYDDDPGF